MIEVKIQNSEDLNEFDRAVKLFKKLCNNDGFIEEIKERRYYTKPSDKKRAELKAKKRKK